ncbi:MFS transporter [Kitasatospora sp. NPDC006697]|uniref:MFS transporter n=1 Tax=Kitasatospora sp. NPDC006697 TaxID=3364020 RepID=UPI00369F033D
MRLLMDLAPLRHREFARVWGAGAVTAVGAQLTAVSIPVRIYALTGSSAQVGLAALVGFGPMAVAALWGGAVADAVDRRRMLLVTNGGIGAVSVLLWLQSCLLPGSVPALLALVAVQQALFGANAAASGAVTPRLVPAAVLPAANALQSTASWSAGIAGPLLAGLLLPVAGVRTLYLADAAALCATLWAVRKLPPLPPTQRRRVRRVGLRQIAEGFRAVAGNGVLRVAYLADFAALFLGLPHALLPQLARETYGPGTLGPLYAALPIGGVLAGLCSGTFTRARRPGAALAAAVCLWGAAIAGFGLTRSPAPALALLALAGGALVALGVFRKTLLQTAATDDLRGRLQGADTVIAAGGPRLAGFAHGAAAAVVGTGGAVTGGGLLTIGAMAALYLTNRRFRRA